MLLVAKFGQYEMMVFKSLCDLVLSTKEASALGGLKTLYCPVVYFFLLFVILLGYFIVSQQTLRVSKPRYFISFNFTFILSTVCSCAILFAWLFCSDATDPKRNSKPIYSIGFNPYAGGG